MKRAREQCVFLLLTLVVLATAEIKNKGWWKNTVFYQIYPRSFMDSNDDGTGDLIGITNKLEHFVGAGVGAIWLSPINKSPMVDFGYDISDFKDVDPLFGKLDDFTKLVDRAHSLGIKVILDLVPNHSSDKHEWFKKSVANDPTYAEYYIWADGKNENKEPPNNWLSVFGGSAWTYNDQRKKWYFHQFDPKQPDLNYVNPQVKDEMTQIIQFWLQKGVDGFRVDAVPHLFEDDISKDEPLSGIEGATDKEYRYLNHIYTKDQPATYDLIQSWRSTLDDYSDRTNTDEKVMMTEAYTSLNNTVKFYNYGSNVPFNFNFIVGADSSSSATDFKKIIDTWVDAMPENAVANWVMGNHDRSRTATRYPGRADQMTMLAMILPGVAVTYNGEEIGMVDKTGISYEDTQDPQGKNAGREKYQEASRDPCRSPFQWNYAINAGFSKKKPWIPVNENYIDLNLEKQKQDSESHYKLYQTLTRMRKSLNALKNGDLKTTVHNDKVLSVVRNDTSDEVALLINFSDTEDQTVDLSKIMLVRGDSAIRAKSVGAPVKLNERIDLSNVNVPAKESIIIVTLAGTSSENTGNNGGSVAGFNSYLKYIMVLVFLFLFKQ